MRNAFSTFSSLPLTYADAAVTGDDRKRRSLARRRRWRKIFLWVAIALVVGGGLFARHAYIQSYRESLRSLNLTADDTLVDVETSLSWNDGERYFRLSLCGATYQSLFSSVTARLPGRDTIFPAEWPWRVPPDAIVREGFGEGYMFSPSTGTVYIYRWSM